MVTRRPWTNILGGTSLALVGYFWLALVLPRLWQPIFPGAGLVVVASLFLSLLMSALSGYCGSSRWYLASATALGTLLFIGLRMH